MRCSRLYRENWAGFATPLEHFRVMTQGMTNTNQHFDNADITSNFTYRKEWDFVYASAAHAGVYTITE